MAQVRRELAQTLCSVRSRTSALRWTHGLALSDVVQLRTYVVSPDFDKLGTIGRTVAAGSGGSLPTHTVIGVAALATPQILFEVEAVAVRRWSSLHWHERRPARERARNAPGSFDAIAMAMDAHTEQPHMAPLLASP